MKNIHPFIVPSLKAVLPLAVAISEVESNKPNGTMPEHLGWDAEAVANENLIEFFRIHGAGTIIVSEGPWKPGAILDGCRRFSIAETLGIKIDKIESIPCADVIEAKRIRWQLNISTQRNVLAYLRVRAFFQDKHFKEYLDALVAEGKRRIREGGKKGGQSIGKGLSDSTEATGGFDRRLEIAKFCMVAAADVYYGEQVFRWDTKIQDYFEEADFPKVRKLIRDAETGRRSSQSVYMHLHNARRRDGRGGSLEAAAALPNVPASNPPGFSEVNKVYQDDCISVMRSMPDGTVDRVVTSPPYFAQKVKYGDDWVGFDSWNAYEEFTVAYLNECWRILKPHGVICINIDDTTEDHADAKQDGREFRDSYDSTGLIKTHLKTLGCRYFQNKVWTKRNMAGKASARGSLCFPNNRPNHEPLIFAWKGKRDPSAMKPTMDERELNEWTLSTWDIAPASDPLHQHPCVFPDELARRMVVYGGNRDDVILDPFCGIGTTLLAAASEGRSWIGIERHSVYAKRAEDAGASGVKEWKARVKATANPRYTPDF